jgi:hypothetical protein
MGGTDSGDTGFGRTGLVQTISDQVRARDIKQR